MRILIIGAGSIGRRYARLASQFGDVAVYDNDHSRMSAASQDTNARAFATLDECFDWQPDGTVIATPPTSHVSLAKYALNNCGHILLEKPISHNVDEADALLTELGKGGGNIYGVCNMRFHDGVEGSRSAIDKIGQPLFTRAYYGSYLPEMRPGTDHRNIYVADANRGGGVIFDAVHEIDYLSWIFGPANMVRCDKGNIGDLDIDADDYAVISLHHASGVRSEIQFDYLQRIKRRGLEIVGSKGTIIWNSEGKNPEICTVRLFEAAQQRWTEIFRSDGLSPDLPYLRMLEQFVAKIEGRAASLQSATEALAVLKVVLAASQPNTDYTATHITQ